MSYCVNDKKKLSTRGLVIQLLGTPNLLKHPGYGGYRGYHGYCGSQEKLYLRSLVI